LFFVVVKRLFGQDVARDLRSPRADASGAIPATPPSLHD
jgi:hypothetical protein